MAAKIRRLKIGVALIVAISFAIVFLAPSPVVPATAYEAKSDGIPLSIQDFSVVPQYIVDDAAVLAAELFGNDQEKCQDFVSQLLAIYLEAKDRDVVIIFNSGGFGWTPIEETPEGQGFITGIESELAALGYSSLLLNHFRTAETLNGCLSELMAEASLYPSKAKDLALRVEFLTYHIPGIRVILAGQSNGAGICERVMRILKNNQQVYSIQLGPPFWNDTIELDRSLVLRSNGEVPDSFSHGDLVTIICANLEALFGISQENPGKILLYIGAPGHEYSWEYERVRSQVTDFLGRWFENQ
jgi:hypothetical protein